MTLDKQPVLNFEELLRIEAALAFRKEFYHKRIRAIRDIRDKLDDADELESETKDELYRYSTLYDKIHYTVQHYEDEEDDEGQEKQTG